MATQYWLGKEFGELYRFFILFRASSSFLVWISSGKEENNQRKSSRPSLPALPKMISYLVVAYLLMAAQFSTRWLRAIKKDTNLSNQDKSLSLLILVVASLFWPIVAPISYCELLINKKIRTSSWSY